RDRGFVEGELSARRFGQKIMAGEMIGYTASPNSFAAIVVTLCILAAALAIQRVRDGESPGAVLPAIAIGVSAWMILYTDSKTAYATPLLAAGLFIAVATISTWMTRHRKLLFSLGVVAILLLILAAVGH